MCDECKEQAMEKAGEPLPDVDEFLRSVLARAEVELETELMARDEELTAEGTRLAHWAAAKAVYALGLRMGEECIVMSPAWLAYLGTERMEQIADGQE